MKMQEITIRVDPNAAAVYLAASEQDRRKLADGPFLIAERLNKRIHGCRAHLFYG